jgi:hypothetical protein
MKRTDRDLLMQIVEKGFASSSEDFTHWLDGKSDIPVKVYYQSARKFIKEKRGKLSKAVLDHALAAVEHPWIDEMNAKVTWARGARKEGLALAIAAKDKWRKDYLYALVDAMELKLHEDIAE